MGQALGLRRPLRPPLSTVRQRRLRGRRRPGACPTRLRSCDLNRLGWVYSGVYYELGSLLLGAPTPPDFRAQNKLLVVCGGQHTVKPFFPWPSSCRLCSPTARWPHSKNSKLGCRRAQLCVRGRQGVPLTPDQLSRSPGLSSEAASGSQRSGKCPTSNGLFGRRAGIGSYSAREAKPLGTVDPDRRVRFQRFDSAGRADPSEISRSVAKSNFRSQASGELERTRHGVPGQQQDRRLSRPFRV